jgi:PAS domain S-box-containing protein
VSPAKRSSGSAGTLDDRRGALDEAYRELAAREARLRAIIQAQPECVKLLAADGTLLEMNPAGLRMIQADSLDAVRDQCVYPLVAEPHRAAFRDLLERTFDGESGTLVFLLIGLKGKQRWLEAQLTPLRDTEGRVTAALGMTRDITERRQAEEALRRSERYLSSLIESVDGIVWEADARTFQFTFVSSQAARLLGYPVSQWLEDPAFWASHIHPEDRERAVQICQKSVSERHGHRFEYRFIAADGRPVWMRDIVSVVQDPDDGVKLRGIMVDVTAEKQAAAALRERERERRAAEERIGRQRAALIALTSRQQLEASDLRAALGRIAETASRTLNVARVSVWCFVSDHSAIECKALHDLAAGPQPDGATLAAANHPAYFQALENSEVISAEDALADPRTREFADDYLRPLGIGAMLDAPIGVGGVRTGVLCHEHVGPVRQWTEDEKTFAVALANLVSLALERTQRHEAEEERRRVEEQLRQAQKMEAIGQLAGGVAHDFNNILTAIVMQAEEVEGTAGVPPEGREGLRQIRLDAERAADLTRQLLLFGRRQVMQSRDLDLNDVVTNLVRMLQRIIGEDVRLQLHLHPNELVTHADAGMLEQALLNLAVNARDAMPKGGLLTIRTTERSVDEVMARLRIDAAPGRYVVLRVTDTGSGIPAEVVPHIFEPFFTTKEPGKGTGLGLATVFGIVKQHRGWIDVETEPGHGTSITVFLPSASAAHAPETADPEQPEPRGGTETVLLVEDDATVRKLMRSALAGHGYRVVEAADGDEALRVWQDHPEGFALLVTDLVMPGSTTGIQLSRRLREADSKLKVIYTSGYSPEIAGREIELRSGENFIQKPFKRGDFLETIRRCLDG